MGEPATDAVGGVGLDEEGRVRSPFELDAEHPDAQHVDQDVHRTPMQEHVGDELPDPAPLDHELGDEPEVPERRPPDRARQRRRRATLMMMIHLTAKVIGPGPKE